MSDVPLKAHIGCGLIFITDPGWVNVDVIGSGAGLAEDCPEAVERWGTSEEDYYGRMSWVTKEACERGISPDYSQLVVQKYGSWGCLPFEDESVSEILSRQVFEHLSITEARQALQEARRVLKMGGIIRVSVPDTFATLEAYRTTGEAFYKRHFTGTLRNQYSFHCMAHTRESLIGLFEEYGLEFIEEEPNIHFYPAITIRCRKVPHASDASKVHLWKAAWQYCGDPLGTPLPQAEGPVVEVGPGSAPLPWADVYVDDNQLNLDRIEGKETCLASVESLPADWTGKFGYSYCAHCLEHVADPLKAAAELSRVSKRGVVVCPNMGKDFLFNHHDDSHLWWVLPMVGDGIMRFLRLDTAARDAMRDSTVSGWQHRLLRYADFRFGPDAAHMQAWFVKNEPLMDVIHHWEGTLRIEVIG